MSLTDPKPLQCDPELLNQALQAYLSAPTLEIAKFFPKSEPKIKPNLAAIARSDAQSAAGKGAGFKPVGRKADRRKKYNRTASATQYGIRAEFL